MVWEQTGEDYVRKVPVNEQEKLLAQFIGTSPYIEGAWMTKRDGTYYLQYAAPATELNTYADGYYTADSPLGPFTYSESSPFSSKPGGLTTGAGCSRLVRSGRNFVACERSVPQSDTYG